MSIGSIPPKTAEEVISIVDYAVKMNELNDDMDIVDCLKTAISSKMVINADGFMRGSKSSSDVVASVIAVSALDSFVLSNRDSITSIAKRLEVERRFRNSMELVS